MVDKKKLFGSPTPVTVCTSYTYRTVMVPTRYRYLLYLFLYLCSLKRLSGIENLTILKFVRLLPQKIKDADRKTKNPGPIRVSLT